MFKARELAFIFILILSFVASALAWQREIQLGYGFGQEADNSNYNHGYFLNAKLVKFDIDSKLIFNYRRCISVLVDEYFALSSYHHCSTITYF